MKSGRLIVLIPALKKTVAFQDDLVKKLAGISLIQRVINKAVEIGAEKTEIYLLTDSEEIHLISERNGVQSYCDSKLVWGDTVTRDYLKQITKRNEYILLLSPYAPLLSIALINRAKQALIDSDMDILKPVKQVKRHLYDKNGQSTINAVFGNMQEMHSVESKVFTLLRTELLQDLINSKPSILSWEVDHDLMEIESYQDWWVCEKLLTRKRIVFRVIGNEKVGMGHIYRALSLAHEITDHEIIFVSDIEHTVAVNKLAGYDYRLDVYENNSIIEDIIKLKPDLVINDILSTTEKDVVFLQRSGIKVINFEDLGDGAKLADLTINELYDEPQYKSKNTVWGHQYFFVRDEFHDAVPNSFHEKVDNILLVFGGVDQHDLSRKMYTAILEICLSRNIKIDIVVGGGYKFYKQLEVETSDEPLVSITKETGVISSIMERSQLAITANGRTIYELAHMNIPAIVISQHDREDTHKFACEENGFIPIGVFECGITESRVRSVLKHLLDDESYRHKLFKRVLKFKFSTNKNKVVNKIISLL